MVKGTTLAGAAAVGVAAWPAAAAHDKAGVFRHGVASGDPRATSVVIWTRVTPSHAATPGSGKGPTVAVRWEVAADRHFKHVLKHGTTHAAVVHDHTVKVDVRGLKPYTRYWYRFSALGTHSRVGRTQTAPDVHGKVHALRMAFLSCSNWTGGYFSAYRHVAARDDLDMVVHLGDYLYEYGNAATEQHGDPGSVRYGPASLIGKRDHVPNHEAATGKDYRQRYGQYRSDPDLADLHARYPWILIFDDHEVCDNAYDGGGVDQQPDNGNFYKRRAEAYAAYVDWQPIRLGNGSLRTPASLQTHHQQNIRFWRRFTYGALADLSALETRQHRSKQDPGNNGSETLATNEANLADPKRHLPDPRELRWLERGVQAGGHRWHLIANQVLFTRAVASTTAIADLLGAAGLPPSLPSNGAVYLDADAWDGYQADQAALMQAIGRSRGDVVVLTGDIHSSWANDLPTAPSTYTPGDTPANNSVGVEFVCPSVTADGFGETLGQGAKGFTGAIQAANSHVRYLDGIGHGFCVLDVTPERARTDWFFISDRTDPKATLSHAAAWETLAGSKHLTQATGALGPRSDHPHQRRHR